MVDIPPGNLTYKEWIAHNTLIPVTVLSLLTIVVPLIDYGFGDMDLKLALSVPWLGLLILTLWVQALGDGIMTKTKYKKKHNGEWE